MRKLITALLFLVLPTLAWAAAPLSLSAASCPAGQFVTGFDASNNIICAASPTGGGTVSLTNDAGICTITGNGTPASPYHIGLCYLPKTVTACPAAPGIDATYNANYVHWAPAVAGTACAFLIPAGFTTGFGFNFRADNGPMSFMGATFVGPTSIAQGQSGDIQLNADGAWHITGVPQVSN